MKTIIERIRQNMFLSVSLLYIVSSFIVKGISFLTTPIFTRLMGSADFGIVSNFTTWEQVLATFICLQVSSGLLPAKVNHAPDRFDSYMKSIVLFALVSAVSIGGIIVLCSSPIADLTKLEITYIPLLCISGFGVAATNICSGYYIAADQPKRKVIFSIASSLVIVVFGLSLVYLFPDNSEGRIVGYTLAYFSICVFCLIKFLRYPLASKDTFKKDIKYALAFGLPLIPHLLANLVNGSADKIFIIYICGESANGIYSVAYSIGQLALVFATACSDAWNPWYFKETKKETDNSKKEIQKYYILYTVTIAMCFAGVMLLTPEIFKMMAPKEYWSGIPCVLYVAAGIFFLFMYRFPLAYEQLNSNTKYVAITTLIAAGVNLLLNSILIPHLGIKGAAIATTISFFVLWIIHEFVARKIIKGYNISIFSSSYSTLLIVFAFGISFLLIDKKFIFRAIVLLVLCIAYCLYAYFRVVKKENYND